MYHMFKMKNLLPSEAAKIKEGERVIITAFLQEEIKEEVEKQKAINSSLS